ncbi:MAG: homoserine dehydrogenase [Ruminococcus sp.]|nr:homoserine dehydrogenase [Ruminococcus sp.]
MAKVAVLGFGVVGGGTVELIYKNKEKIEKSAGKSIDVKYILDLRDFPDSPFADKVVHDINVILNDDEVTLVAECMGGVNPAYDFVKGCLERGKSVATSNKELVAQKGAELLKIAKEKNCNFFFEASVGGAIPIIRPMHQCLAANEITSVSGILNGTTNFILTKMINENMKFDDALKMAQQLGYAEADPTADVEGLDACRKICILSSLAFGKHVYPDSVHTEGITKITPEDIEYAENWGGSVKLIGTVKKLDNGKILPLVAPHFVCSENPISSVSDVFNAVMVCGDAIDRAMFYGRGAGKFPTASAVVADIIDAAKADGTSISQVWEDAGTQDFIDDYSNCRTRMYIRLSGADKSAVEKAFEDVEFLARENAPSGEVAFVTNEMRECDIDEKLSAVGGEVLGKIRLLEV